MRRFLMTMGLLSAALALGTPAHGQSEEKEKEEVGVEAGEKAPEFKLKGQDGKEYALKKLLEKNKVALVFYRSADW